MAFAQTNEPPPSWLVPVESGVDANLPHWLHFNGQYRNRYETFSGVSFKSADDHHDLDQTRLSLTLQPLSWLQFFGEVQDSRMTGNTVLKNAPPYQDTWDIRQAYIQLGDPKKGWFDIVAGRQMMSFGDERVIGPSNWSNQGRTFDVVRLDLRHGNSSLSLFASSVIISRDGVIDHHLQGNNLHGAYASFKGLIPKATFEPYVLWRVAPGKITLNENAGRGALSEVTLGARVDGKLPARFGYNVEMDKQTGSLGSGSIDAWAGHWNLSFSPIKSLRPFAEANYASGTSSPRGKDWHTFDQIYPSSHNKLGFADQIGWRNIRQVRFGASEFAGRSWKFTETYENFWLADVHDFLYSSGGAPIARSLAGTAGRHVGQEVDAWAEWNWRKAVDFGFGWVQLFTGQFLKATTAGHNFHSPFVYLTYHFTRQPML